MTIRRIDLACLGAQRAWDARAVDAPGGDVHQGSAWLAYRASLGREAIALEIDDTPVGILLNRAPLVGLIHILFDSANIHLCSLVCVKVYYTTVLVKCQPRNSCPRLTLSL
jgi:hypothetical protein